MRKILSLFVLCFGLLVAKAQIKTSEKCEISVPGLQNCDPCIEKLQIMLSREDGVTALKINVKAKKISFTYLTDRNSKENLKAAIANLGYQADDVEPEEVAQKRLPACCKVPVVEAPVKKSK